MSEGGVLRFLYNDEWGTACDDLFDKNTADVFCSQLGYSSGLVMGQA